jgi:hypothetical protein
MKYYTIFDRIFFSIKPAFLSNFEASRELIHQIEISMKKESSRHVSFSIKHFIFL